METKPQFFVNQKRGEVNELRTLLRSLPADADAPPQNRSRRREVFKRLVAYMTMGIDVSPLFPDVVLSSATTDPVQKKLLALYMSNYAEQNPDLSILAINALQKDLRDVDPRIRGLALKALTSLRANTVAEYAHIAVRDGLNDPSSYVRRSAIMGVLKLLSSPASAEVCTEEAKRFMIESVQRNLTATEPQLFINALVVLNEIDPDFQADRKIIVQLFNRMSACDVFGRTLILSMLADYVPKSNPEMLSLLDALENQLVLASPSIVVSTLRVMLAFAKNAAEEDQHWTEAPLVLSCLRRACPALLTLLSSASLESNFSVLVCIRQILCMGESFCKVFAPSWLHLMPRLSDKPYNKLIRLDIIDYLIDESNAKGIFTTLQNFLSPPTSVEPEVLRRALAVLANVSLKSNWLAQEIIEYFLSLYEMEEPTVCNSVLPAMAVSMSRHANLADEILPFMGEPLEFTLLEPRALKAFVWMVGECPNRVHYVTPLFHAAMEKAFSALDDQQLPPSTAPEEVELLMEHDGLFATTLFNDLLIASCKILFVDPLTVEEFLSELLSRMTERADDLPFDVVERLQWTLHFMTSNQQVLKKVFSPEALVEQRKQREETLGKHHCPAIPLSRLNTISSVCSSHVFLLPFGRTKLS